MFTRPQIATVVAEFLGTATLVMVALIMSQTTAVSYFIGTSLAVTLAALFLFFGNISGAQLNPALTFGLWTARQISTLRAVLYVAAQLLGGLAALELFQYLVGRDLPAKNLAFNTPMWLAEVVGTAVLAVAIAVVVSRKLDSFSSALALGAGIFTGVIVAGTASAGYINPAIALGERSFNSVYVLGPLVGGLIGVNLYMMLMTPRASRPSRLSRRRK
ncbi:MAG TPA: aquaporin [Candidatus Saccharimonadales bacterium]|nr:aquaporin [Candidatus Saccharimonadales bacterium]